MRGIVGRIMRLWVVIFTAYALLLPSVLLPANPALAADHVLCIGTGDSSDGDSGGGFGHAGKLCCVLCAATPAAAAPEPANIAPLRGADIAAAPVAARESLRGPPAASPRQPRAPPPLLV